MRDLNSGLVPHTANAVIAHAAAPMATTRPNSQTTKSSPVRISQHELAQYHALKSQRDRLDEEIQTLRASLIGRIKNDASIEPGNFRVRVQSSMQKKFNAKTLKAVLEPEEFEDLKRRIAPTPSNYLYVSEEPLNGVW